MHSVERKCKHFFIVANLLLVFASVTTTTNISNLPNTETTNLTVHHSAVVNNSKFSGSLSTGYATILHNSSDPRDITFTVGARNLPNTYPGDDEPDPFAELHGALGYGKTKTIKNNRNPEWPEIFRALYVPNSLQVMNIEVRDDSSDSYHDSFGWATFYLDDIAQECKMYVFKLGNGPGHVVVNTCPTNASPMLSMTTTVIVLLCMFVLSLVY